MNILQQIVATKRIEVAAAKKLISPTMMADLARRNRRTPVSLASAIRSRATGIIAEFKRRSPSKGEIKAMAHISEIIPAYSEAGAAGISVLTDTPHFGGSLTDLAVARSLTDTPLLRKEFIIDDYQIYEARAAGADAILLIAAILSRSESERFVETAHSLGLEVLFETHNEEEAARIPQGVDMVGVNSRDLSSFTTSLDVARRMIDALPRQAVKIAESGIHSAADIAMLRRAGFDGFLIGEAFMSTPSPGRTLREFIDNSHRAKPRLCDLAIKVCGMREPANIEAVSQLAPELMGFIFYGGTPRDASGLEPGAMARLPEGVRPVAVFVDAPRAFIGEIIGKYGFGIIQLHGSESPEECRYWRGRGVKVIKAISVGGPEDIALTLGYENAVDAFVFDTRSDKAGGSGKHFDRSLLDAYSGSIPYLLSGGIGPDDLPDIISALRPGMIGIDINSRFESSPGVKDPELLKNFILFLRHYDQDE